MMQKSFQNLRIVFMGTPEFAVASLKKLVEHGANIVGVVTAPDKPAGRGMQLQQSAVKQYALSQNLTVLQPEKLKNAQFLDTLKQLKADLQIVVAFRMLPELVWNMPPMGTINVHGSLLPDYRGAAPINWAIINGEKETGITTFKLKQEIDTGNIIMQERLEIGPDENAGSVHDRMMELGANVLIKTVQAVAMGTITEIPQPETKENKHAPKIFTETCEIDWTKSINDVHNLVRGLSPYPAAFTSLHGKKLKVFSGTKINCTPEKPGQIESDGKSFLRFHAADGCYDLLEIQLEGKKKMNVQEFLRGYRFPHQ